MPTRLMAIAPTTAAQKPATEKLGTRGCEGEEGNAVVGEVEAPQQDERRGRPEEIKGGEEGCLIKRAGPAAVDVKPMESYAPGERWR